MKTEKKQCDVDDTRGPFQVALETNGELFEDVRREIDGKFFCDFRSTAYRKGWGLEEIHRVNAVEGFVRGVGRGVLVGDYIVVGYEGDEPDRAFKVLWRNYYMAPPASFEGRICLKSSIVDPYNVMIKYFKLHELRSTMYGRLDGDRVTVIEFSLFGYEKKEGIFRGKLSEINLCWPRSTKAEFDEVMRAYEKQIVQCHSSE